MFVFCKQVLYTVWVQTYYWQVNESRKLCCRMLPLPCSSFMFYRKFFFKVMLYAAVGVAETDDIWSQPLHNHHQIIKSISFVDDVNVCVRYLVFDVLDFRETTQLLSRTVLGKKNKNCFMRVYRLSKNSICDRLLRQNVSCLTKSLFKPNKYIYLEALNASLSFKVTHILNHGTTCQSKVY